MVALKKLIMPMTEAERLEYELQELAAMYKLETQKAVDAYKQFEQHDQRATAIAHKIETLLALDS